MGLKIEIVNVMDLMGVSNRQTIIPETISGLHTVCDGRLQIRIAGIECFRIKENGKGCQVVKTGTRYAATVGKIHTMVCIDFF